MGCWGKIESGNLLEIVPESARKKDNPVGPYSTCRVDKVTISFDIDGATGNSYLYKVYQEYSVADNHGCEGSASIDQPAVSENLNFTATTTGYFKYGKRFYESSGRATNTTAPSFPDIEGVFPVPFCVPTLDEDGNPFSQWDGATTAKPDYIPPDGSYRPSKYSNRPVTVYGSGSDYCVKLTAAQLSRLYYCTNKMKITVSASITAGAATAYGDIQYCIDGNTRSESTSASIPSNVVAVPIINVRRSDITQEVGDPPVVDVDVTSEFPELHIFENCNPSVNGGSYYFDGTTRKNCLGPILCSSSTLQKESPDGGYTSEGYTGWAYVSSVASATSVESRGSATDLATIIPSASNTLLTGDGEYWFKPPMPSLRAGTDAFSFSGNSSCGDNYSGYDGTTAPRPSLFIDNSIPSHSAGFNGYNESTESHTGTSGNYINNPDGTEGGTGGTTGYPVELLLTVDDLDPCAFMKVICYGVYYTGGSIDARLCYVNNLDCPSEMWDQADLYDAKLRPDYIPPGYEEANAAWKAAIVAINEGIINGTLVGDDVNIQKKLANWEAYNAATIASIDFTTNIGADNAYPPIPFPQDTTGPVAINPETGDPYDPNIPEYNAPVLPPPDDPEENA